MEYAQIYGVTRFSVYLPGSGAWKLTRNLSAEETRTYYDTLYGDERMEARFFMFSRAAEIYQRMSEARPYRHIVQYSSVMPDKWKKYLVDLARRYPVLLLDEVESKGIDTEATIQSLMVDSDARSGPMAYFRVDDDDMLSSDYLLGLTPYVCVENVGRAISFGQGLAAILTPEGLTEFRQVHWPLLGLGMAYVGSFDSATGSLKLPRPPAHSRTDMRFPVILDSRDVKFVWVHHMEQDTKTGATHAENVRRIERTFAKWERLVDVESAVAKFPSIGSDLIGQAR